MHNQSVKEGFVYHDSLLESGAGQGLLQVQLGALQYEILDEDLPLGHGEAFVPHLPQLCSGNERQSPNLKKVLFCHLFHLEQQVTGHSDYEACWPGLDFRH